MLTPPEVFVCGTGLGEAVGLGVGEIVLVVPVFADGLTESLIPPAEVLPVPDELVWIVPPWPFRYWLPVVLLVAALFVEVTVDPSLRNMPDCTPAWLRIGS